MTPNSATTTSTSTPAPQATVGAVPGPQPTSASQPAAVPASPSSAASSPASGPKPSPASPGAPQPTPVQLLWEVATLAFELMRRLVNVLQPIQQYYPKQALLLARLLIDIPRIFLTLRYAPERVTMAQLRHLTRARHILQALFGYTLPLGPRTSSSATPTVNQSPFASTENATPLGPRTSSSATTPSPAISTAPSPNAPSSTTPGTRKPSSATSATPSIREVPEIPLVAGVSHVPASPTVERSPLTPDPSPASHDSHPSHDSHSSQSPHSKGEDPVGLRNPIPHSVAPHSALRAPHSPFSPYIPDFHTLAQALKADSLPPNCAGALFENPGDALVRALHQLHTIYFSLYPHQPPTQSPSPSPSQSPSSGNLQSSIFNLQSDNPQSGNPQSDAPSVHSVHNVHPVHSTSDNSHLPLDPSHSSYPSHPSHSPHSEFRIPHSAAPP